jgi:hypothetical protein
MAINTAAKVRDEGNWRAEGWSPLIANESEYDTFVSDMLDRANNYLRYRVGATWYTANVGVDPIDDILKEAEMHLAQAQILIAAAGIAETGSDTNTAPFLGTAEEILKVAAFRQKLAEELILSTRAFGSQAKALQEVTRGR